MKAFFIDTDEKLKGIFTDLCSLKEEQYNEIKSELIYLISDYQEEEPEEEIKKRINYLKDVFMFLYNTKELTRKELTDLNDLVFKIKEEGEKEWQKG